MTTLFICIAFVVGLIIGYKFCKMRWRCEDTLATFKDYLDFNAGKISPEYFLENYKKRFGDLK